ncbi:MAG: TRAP transporter permease, partial [Deltaproteobacteria bacterium]|nr:TRAP transporter permease [Deltaproteobacteria bacterium]
MEKQTRTVTEWIASGVAVFLSLFSLYTGTFGMFSSMFQKPFHLMLILIVVFLLYPKKQAQEKTKAETAVNIFFILLSIISCLWIIFNFERYYIEIFLDNTGIAMGTILCLVLIEATRRTLGWPLAIIGIAFYLYAVFGGYLPGMLSHQGNVYERVIASLYATTGGIFGIPLSVCATFVILFVIFGAFLNVSGADRSFMDLALSLAGKSTGGVAKVAVVSSGMMGMISGSTVANVATTGAVTIPMMKRRGYPPHIAGAIEAVASTGGQFTPPIMGAAAFIIAEFIGVSYIKVAFAAAIPAGIYYVLLFFAIHFISLRMGFLGLPAEEIPSFRNAFFQSIHLTFPISVLVILMVLNYTPMFAALWSILALLTSCMFREETRLNVKKLLLGLEKGGATMAPISTACATAGLVVGVLAMTGLGMKFSYLLVTISRNNLFIALFLTMLASLLLGMGLPTSASYLILAAIGAPALIKMGAPKMGAHLFIFYFAIISNITPPVCLASYTAAGLAGARPQKTAFEAVRISIVLYVIPYIFVYHPALILEAAVSDILIAVPTYVLGVICAAAAMQNHLIVRNRVYERALIMLAGIGLL